MLTQPTEKRLSDIIASAWGSGTQAGAGPIKGALQNAAPAAVAVKAAEGIKPFSDRLAKIGLFIGGSGGARGEKAQRDTALHTGKLVELTQKLLEKKPDAGGVFA